MDGLQRMKSDQQTYQDSLSDTKSNSKTDSDIAKAGVSVVTQANQVGALEIGQQMSAAGGKAVNPQYQAFQSTAGPALESLPSAGKYMKMAAEKMNSLSSDDMRELPGGGAKQALQRHFAAAHMLADPNSSREEKVAAGNYLTGEFNALGGFAFKGGVPSQEQVKPFDVAAPKNETGIVPNEVKQQVERSPVGPEKHGSDAKPANSHGGHSSHKGAPAITPSKNHNASGGSGHSIVPDQAQTLKDSVLKGAQQDIHDLEKKVAAGDKDAARGHFEHGTAVRAAALVGSNVLDAVGAGKSTSRKSGS